MEVVKEARCRRKVDELPFRGDVARGDVEEARLGRHAELRSGRRPLRRLGAEMNRERHRQECDEMGRGSYGQQIVMGFLRAKPPFSAGGAPLGAQLMVFGVAWYLK